MRTIRRRRKEGKTDYKARLFLLKSGLPRIVLRRSNKYFTAQYVQSQNAQDKVVIGVNSKDLLKYGWDKNKAGSLKSKTAGYLTGFLLGKKILDRELPEKAIFDIGLRRSIAKSRIYAFAMGIIDSGIKMNVKKEFLPQVENVENIKKEIERKFA